MISAILPCTCWNCSMAMASTISEATPSTNSALATFLVTTWWAMWTTALVAPQALRRGGDGESEGVGPVLVRGFQQRGGKDHDLVGDGQRGQHARAVDDDAVGGLPEHARRQRWIGLPGGPD